MGSHVVKGENFLVGLRRFGRSVMRRGGITLCRHFHGMRYQLMDVSISNLKFEIE
jgi:hypothetical protein